MAGASPANLCLAEVLHDHVGDETHGTLSAERAQLVLVSGDRRDAPEGWVYAQVAGEAGLLPVQYLRMQAGGSFSCRALYDFDAAEDNELSFVASDLLTCMPSATDPSGWCTAAHRVSREKGFVPQAYLAPANPRATSSSTPPTVDRSRAPPRTLAVDESPLRPLNLLSLIHI